MYVVLCAQKLHELESKEKNISNLKGQDEFEKEHRRIREKELKEQMVHKVCFPTALSFFSCLKNKLYTFIHGKMYALRHMKKYYIIIYYYYSKCRDLCIMGYCL